MLVAGRGTRKIDFAVVFFFFQAEDGIRDLTVTGVQTCALPIYPAQELHDVAPVGALVLAQHTERQGDRSEEHTSELQSQSNLVCRLLLEKKKIKVAARRQLQSAV